MSIDRDQLEHNPLWPVLLDQLGGRVVAAWLDAHYAGGEPLHVIAARHGLATSTVHKKITRLRGVLAMAGVLPMEWRERDRVHRVRDIANISRNQNRGAA